MTTTTVHDTPKAVRATIRFASGMWLGISMIVLVLMLLHTSEPAQIMGRYSARYVLLLCAVSGVLVLSGIIYGLARWKRTISAPRWWRARWVGIGIFSSACMAIPALLLINNNGVDVAPNIFTAYGVGFVISLSLIWLRATGQTAHAVPIWILVLLLSLSAIVSIILVIRYLGWLPNLIYYDEVWMFNRSYSYVNYNMVNSSSIWPEKFEPLNTNATLALTGHWMSLTNVVSFANGRLFLLGLAYVGIGISSLTAWRLYGRTAALAGAAIGLLIPLLHNYFRANNMVMLATSIGLWFYFAAEHTKSLSGQIWCNVLTGVAIGFTLEGHVYGISFVGAFGLVYFVRAGLAWRQGRNWDALALLAAYSTGLALYGIFFILFRIPPSYPTLIDWLSELLRRYSLESNLPSSCSLMQRLVVCLPLHFGDYVRHNPVEVMLIVASAGALLWRLRLYQSVTYSSDRTLAALWGLSVLSFGIVLSHANPYYWIYNLPFLVILGGAALAQLGGKLTEVNLRLGTIAGTAMVVFALALHTPLGNPAQIIDRASERLTVGRQIVELLPPDTLLLADLLHYLAMPENPNFVASVSIESQEKDRPYEAVLLTENIDTSIQALQRVITAQDLMLAQCFQNHSPTASRLYVSLRLLPKDAPIDCGRLS